MPHAEGAGHPLIGGFSADEYVTGWVKRGPTGVIGTNKSDAVETVTSLLARRPRRRRSWPHGRIGGALDRRARRARHRAARHRRLGTGSMRRRSNWVEATAAAERRWRTAASCWRLPEMITSQPEPTMSFDLTRQHFSGEVRRLRDSRFHDQIVELHLHRVLRIFVGFGQESDGASSQRIF